MAEDLDAPRQSHYGRYLALEPCLPLLAFLLTFPLAASQGFLRISRRPLWHATEYRFILPPQQNCDVVITGDSSGMIGVDPHALEARTGWKTCNIGLPYIGTAFAGTRVLDAYLAPPASALYRLPLRRKPSPRPILNEDNGIIDGWLMVDEHFPAGEKLRIFARHPLDTLRFVTAVWKEFLAATPILRPDWTGGTYRADMEQQIANRGWMAERGTTPDVVCGWQPPPALQTERSWLDSLTARYTRGGTRAIIWSNPARDCDNRIAQYRENARSLNLLPTAVYSRALFFDAYHLNTEGAARNATELADYLESLQPER